MTDTPLHPAAATLAGGVHDLHRHTVRDGADLAAILSSLGAIAGDGVLGELADVVGDWSELVDDNSIPAIADRPGATAALRQVADLLHQAAALAGATRASL